MIILFQFRLIIAPKRKFNTLFIKNLLKSSFEFSFLKGVFTFVDKIF